MSLSRVQKFLPKPLAPTATVTVVITCYNYAQYLPDAARSALEQEGVNVDVIVVDDASSDASLRVARTLAAEDSRVTVIANRHNLGAPGAFNRGLAEATGEFLVRLDADDLLTPGSLSRSVAVMQSLPNVGLVYGHPLHFTGTQLPPARVTPTHWAVWPGADWLTLRCADGTNVLTSPEVTMRRDILTRIGGMRPLAHTHDMELWLRLAAHADVAHIGGVDQAWHREHEKSLSKQAEKPIVILQELRAAFTELFAALGEHYPRAAELHALSKRGVAAQALAQARRVLDRGQESDLVDALRSFARETDPTIESTPMWRQFERRRTGALPRPLIIAAGLTTRLARRLQAIQRAARWRRTGVYERVRFTRARSSA